MDAGQNFCRLIIIANLVSLLFPYSIGCSR